jgi:hypothetical protein
LCKEFKNKELSHSRTLLRNIYMYYLQYAEPIDLKILNYICHDPLINESVGVPTIVNTTAPN